MTEFEKEIQGIVTDLVGKHKNSKKMTKQEKVWLHIFITLKTILEDQMFMLDIMKRSVDDGVQTLEDIRNETKKYLQ